jgi:hypothetical protein
VKPLAVGDLLVSTTSWVGLVLAANANTVTVRWYKMAVGRLDSNPEHCYDRATFENNETGLWSWL